MADRILTLADGQPVAVLAAAGTDIPGVKLAGIVIGVLLLIAAMRGLFRKW